MDAQALIIWLIVGAIAGGLPVWWLRAVATG
jgi:hypothetical protein